MEQLSLVFDVEPDEESEPDVPQAPLRVRVEGPLAARPDPAAPGPIGQRPEPPIPRQVPRSCADVLSAVEAATDLKPSRRRDLVSALRSLSRLCRLPLESLPAQPRELRPLLQAIHPAAFDMSAKRFANIKADLALALDIAHGRAESRSRGAPLPEKWRVLWDACPSDWFRIQLSRFIRWCANQGIRPGNVGGGTLTSFLAHCDERDLELDPAQLRRRIAHSYNKCADQVPGWPPTKLPLVPARETWTLPWQNFHPDLCRQVDLWLEQRANPDLLDDEGPSRPLRPLTIKERRYQLRMAASTLVAGGVPADDLRGFADLVRRDRAYAALNGLRQRYGKKSNTPHGVATTLRTVAKYCFARNDDNHDIYEDDIELLNSLCRTLHVKKRGLTQKNRNRLLPFQDPATRDRFLLLPEKLMRSAAEDGRNPYHAAGIAQRAVALEIAQMAPLRARNLASLEIGRHLIFVGHGRDEYAVVSIPEEETKTEIALEYPLPKESTRLIRHYIECLFAEAVPAGNPLPVSWARQQGESLAATLSTQVEKTIRDSLGHRVNLHLLRHFAAMIYLQAYPGAYEAVRRILGHATASTALDYYTGFEATAAVRQFDEVVLRHRRLAEDRAQTVKGRKRGGGR